jgi:dolichol-phosphate mannosyltransferase
MRERVIRAGSHDPPTPQRNAANDTGHPVTIATLARFAVSSLAGTALDFLLLWVLVSHVGLAILPAKAMAMEATIVNAFVWNNAWTFHRRTPATTLRRRFLVFHGMYAGGVLLSLIVIGLLVATMGPRWYLLYNALTLPVTFIWTYLWSARVIWRPVAYGDA